MTGHVIEEKVSVARKNSVLRQKIRGDPSYRAVKAEHGRPELVAVGGLGLAQTTEQERSLETA